MTDLRQYGLVVAGLALLAGGTLQAAAHQQTFSTTVTSLPYQAGAWATVVGCLMLVALLPYRSDVAAAGPATAAVVGSSLLAALAFAEATVNPALADSAPALLDDSPATTMAVGLLVSTGVFALSWLVVGIALLRRGGAAGPAAAIVLGAVASFVPMVPGPALLGLALVWLGTTRVSDVTTPAREVSPAAGG